MVEAPPEQSTSNCRAVLMLPAEAEAIKPFQYAFMLEDPLSVRTVNFSHNGSIALHLHTFMVSRRPQRQQQCLMDAMLSMAVGAAERCAAVPGSTPGAGSTSRSSSNTSSMGFGVLLWEPLPEDADLQWPVWNHQEQQQPHVVRVQLCMQGQLLDHMLQ